MLVKRCEQKDPESSDRPGKVRSRVQKLQQQSRTSVFDLYKEWCTSTDRCLKDLEHLVQLLVQGSVAPQILDRIPLNKVARAQEMIQAHSPTGYLVCEPWLVSKSVAIRL